MSPRRALGLYILASMSSFRVGRVFLQVPSDSKLIQLSSKLDPKFAKTVV
jgi:hypothetical protein